MGCGGSGGVYFQPKDEAKVQPEACVGRGRGARLGKGGTYCAADSADRRLSSGTPSLASASRFSAATGSAFAMGAADLASTPLAAFATGAACTTAAVAARVVRVVVSFMLRCWMF